MKTILFLLPILWILTASSQATELWNVSPSGGLNQRGLIYKINGDGSGFEELISMDSLGADNLCGELTLSQGYVYGFAYKDTAAFLYRVNTTTRSYEKLANLPSTISSSRYFSKLTGVNGRLYFIAASGGSNGYGGIYAYDTTTQAILSLVDFSTQTGVYPAARQVVGLVLADSSLYGAAKYGGEHGVGTIYKYTPSTNVFDVVFNFGGSNSELAFPYTNLVAVDNYTLMGFSMDTLWNVLAPNAIFGFNKNTNTFFEWRRLNKLDGVDIAPQIIFAPDGFIYASARRGGPDYCVPAKDYGCGMLIRYRPYDDLYEKILEFSNGILGWPVYHDYNFFTPGITLGYDGNIYSTVGTVDASRAYRFSMIDDTLTIILNHEDSIMLADDGYYNFVNVTNGYLGINEPTASGSDFLVYPNPAAKFVTIEDRSSLSSAMYRFKLFDVQGRLVYEQTAHERKITIDLSDFSQGLYFWNCSNLQGGQSGKLSIVTHD